MPAVKIEIDKYGEITMDYQGFHGSDCKLKEARLKEVLDELGLTKTAEKEKKVGDALYELERA
jgi:hypothetical protein